MKYEIQASKCSIFIDVFDIYDAQTRENTLTRSQSLFVMCSCLLFNSALWVLHQSLGREEVRVLKPLLVSSVWLPSVQVIVRGYIWLEDTHTHCAVVSVQVEQSLRLHCWVCVCACVRAVGLENSAALSVFSAAAVKSRQVCCADSRRRWRSGRCADSRAWWLCWWSWLG